QGLVVLAVDRFIDELRFHDDPVEVLVVEREGDEGVDAPSLHLEAVGNADSGSGKSVPEPTAHVPYQLAQRVDLAGAVQVEGSLSHAGSSGDAGDGGAREALLAALGLGGLEQLAARSLAAGRHRLWQFAL